MVGALVKGLTSVGVRVFMALASEKMIEWLLFYVAQQVVLSTKTPHDDKLYQQLKKAYNNE